MVQIPTPLAFLFCVVWVMRALEFEAAVLVNVIVNAANTLKVNEKRIKIVITGKQNEQEIKLKATLAAINST